MSQYEIAVVGGGPVGCFVAEQLSMQGRQVVLFEEHRTIGEPVHCAGLISQRVLDITRCPQEEVVQNRIYGAIIHSPKGDLLTIGGDKIHALVIDRQKFDAYIARNAQKAGTTLLLQHKFVALAKHLSTLTIKVQHEDQQLLFHCNLLIGADGAYSRVRTIIGVPKPREMLPGISAEISDVTLDPKYVHIYVGNRIAPGFFAWVIPTNVQGTSARIGLCIRKQHSRSLHHYFTTLLAEPLLRGTTVTKRFGGIIPLGPLKKTTDERIMLVGDAAAQVKPTSGGGLYPGLSCARHCSSTAEEMFRKQCFDKESIRRYHIRWRSDIGRELALGMRFRTVFTRLTDNKFDKYLKKLNEQKTLDIINAYGDIDYPSHLALPLLKTSPSLLALAPTVLKRGNQ
jgi:digeranylgeranylglycerophospholipid reductase